MGAKATKPAAALAATAGGSGLPSASRAAGLRVKTDEYDLTYFVYLGGVLVSDAPAATALPPASPAKVVAASAALFQPPTPSKPLEEMTPEEKAEHDAKVERAKQKAATAALMERNLKNKSKHPTAPPPTPGGFLSKAKKMVQEKKEQLEKAAAPQPKKETTHDKVVRQALAAAGGSLTGGATAGLGEEIAKSQMNKDLTKKRAEFEKEEQARKKKEADEKKAKELEKEKNKPKGLGDFLSRVQEAEGSSAAAPSPTPATEAPKAKLAQFLSASEPSGAAPVSAASTSELAPAAAAPVAPVNKLAAFLSASEPPPAASEPPPASDPPPTSALRRLSQALSQRLSVKSTKEAPTATTTSGPYEAFLSRLDEVRVSHPENRCAKYLTREVFASFSEEQQAVLHKCCRTGAENPDSGIGAYAMRPQDYAELARFFDPLIRDYHRAAPEAKHATDWDIASLGALDVAALGLQDTSMRIRVGRNLTKYNLPGAMTREERVAFEKDMLRVFDTLMANPAYGGRVYSLTPELGEGEANPNLIASEEYERLVRDHVMFKSMDSDPYLKSAGIASDWPYGRGCYQSEDKEIIVWFGEEDQLRIMCMKPTGTLLSETFARLKSVLDVIESLPGMEFAKSENFGYVTSCPSNLGTGMRASVLLKVPNLTRGGSDAKAKEVCKPLGLSVRGMGGEHTPIGEDGTIDLSPSARLFVTEKEILLALYTGIEKLMELEKQAVEAA